MTKQTKKKIFKATVTSAAVLGASCVAFGELFYEAFINRKFFTPLLHTDALMPDEALEEYTYNADYLAGREWFENLNLADTKLRSHNGYTLHGYVIHAEEKTDRWAIVVHGYSDVPSSMAQQTMGFLKRGYNVLLPNLVAHGLDERNYCSMGYYDRYIVKEWINWIVRRETNAQIVLLGVSMGAATVMLTTGEELPLNVKCAVADCGYTSAWDEYSCQLKALFNIPTFPFLYIINEVSKFRGNFDFKKCSPKNAVTHSETPTLFIHGNKDDFVPFEMMDILYNACSAPKDKLEIEGAIHAASVLKDPESYWKKIDEFLLQYIPAASVSEAK